LLRQARIQQAPEQYSRIASPAPRKPSAAFRSRALGAGNHVGNFFCEPLPDGIDEPHGPVPDDELILVAVGRDRQFESGAGHFFRCSPGEMLPRRPE